MRKGLCVPMITLCLLLAGCGAKTEKAESASLREPYQQMSGCTAEAVVRCSAEDLAWEGTLRCEYVPDGESCVEVLAPERIAGVKAVFTDSDWRLEYEDMCLDIGPLSEEALSPALCLPRLMHALRDGWLLEENEEEREGVPCVRLLVDQSGENGAKIFSALWLRREDGTPLWGEIAVDEEVIFTAEFTAFSFYDTIGTPMEETPER